MDTPKPKKTKGFYRFGDFTIEIKEHCLRHGDEIVPLTPKEFEVLFFLVEREGKLPKRMIC